MLERLAWRLLGRRNGAMRFTDDTQMSLDIAESLATLGRLDPDDLAQRFARSYQWSRGYGPAAAKLLKRIGRGMPWQEANRSVYPDGSYGNGGAMRVAPVAMFFAAQPGELVAAARASACITHAHPLGEEGAVVVAAAVAAAALATEGSAAIPKVLAATVAQCSSSPFVARSVHLQELLQSPEPPSPQHVRQLLGNGIAASDSCVTAVYCALRFWSADFLAMLGFVANLGGDVDTIGAMAGAIWCANNGVGRLPEQALAKLEQRERLLQAARALHTAVPR